MIVGFSTKPVASSILFPANGCSSFVGPTSHVLVALHCVQPSPSWPCTQHTPITCAAAQVPDFILHSCRSGPSVINGCPPVKSTSILTGVSLPPFGHCLADHKFLVSRIAHSHWRPIVSLCWLNFAPCSVTKKNKKCTAREPLCDAQQSRCVGGHARKLCEEEHLNYNDHGLGHVGYGNHLIKNIGTTATTRQQTVSVEDNPSL